MLVSKSRASEECLEGASYPFILIIDVHRTETANAQFLNYSLHDTPCVAKGAV